MIIFEGYLTNTLIISKVKNKECPMYVLCDPNYVTVKQAVVDHRFTVHQAPPQALHTMTTTRAAWVRPSTSPMISTSFPQITQPN